MHFFKQHDDTEEAGWDKSGTVYKQHPPTPSAPDMGLSDDEMAKHVPTAIAIPIDPPFSPNRNQLPPERAIGADSQENQKPTASSRVHQISMLMVFHLGNFVLAVTAFTLVVTFFSLSIGLLPLCCFGVIIFQMLAWMTEYFAKFDIALANLIIASDTNEKLRVHHRITSGFTAPDRNSLVSEMTFVSSRSFGAMVYFMTIKFAVGILSCIVAACVFGAPISAIAAAAGVSGVEIVGLAYDDNPGAFVFSVIGVVVVGLLLLRVVASLSRKLTAFACAEPPLNRETQGCHV